MGDKKTFFQQSGWMVAATTLGGVLMWAVHKVATGYLSGSEYGVFGMFLRALNLMTIPACGLQAVFARQAAIALDDDARQQLSALIRGVMRWIFFFWIICSLGVLAFHSQLMELFKLSGSFLFLAVLIGLLILIRPIGVGLLQGRQDFLWVGWSQIVDGAGRLGLIALVLALMKGQSSGALLGVMGGILLCIALCAWRTHDLWCLTGTKIKMSHWIKTLAPLTFGAGIPLFMISADSLVVKAVFPENEVALYAAAGIVSQALIFFTLPVTAVMFPKVARSAVGTREAPVLLLTIGVTGLMGGCVVLGTFLFPELPIRIMFSPDYIGAKELIPWFALAMFPLTLSTVLINNLLARGEHTAVPWLWVIAVAYLSSLCIWHASFREVILQIGIYNTLLLGVTLFFSFQHSRK